MMTYNVISPYQVKQNSVLKAELFWKERTLQNIATYTIFVLADIYRKCVCYELQSIFIETLDQWIRSDKILKSELMSVCI